MLFQKKNKILTAVASGTAVPLERVPDEAFAGGMLGIGAAIDPTDGTIYSPVNGQIESVADSKHAYSIVTEDGLDLLIHIGIDTVKLKGEGFLPMVNVGDTVKQGEVIARVDLNLLRGGNFPCVIPVLFTDADRIADWKLHSGKMIGGESKFFEYRLK